METIKVNRNLSNIDDVHVLLNKTMNAISGLAIGAKISLDFWRLRYITPIGFTGLLSILDYLEEKYEVEIKVPFTTNPVKYMERMNFFKICSDKIRIQFERQMDMDSIYKRNRNNLDGELLEINKAEDHDQIEEISALIKRIFKNKGLKGHRLSDIQSFITELGNNVIDHAESACFIAVKNNDDEDEIEIAVTDSGRGIYDSLKEVLRDHSPHEVIKKAINTTASRLQDEDRGKGLMEIKQRAFKWSDASISLRTYNAVYEITEDGVVVDSEGESAFGTFFLIKVKYDIDRL